MNEKEFHCFNIKVAKRVGVKEAILFNFISNEIVDAEIYEDNYYDGKYWCVRSAESISEHLPYMTEKSIRYSLNKLISEGFIIDKSNPYDKFDKTKWYTIGKMGEEYVKTS